MLVDPLRRDDCALISDGGAALVLMTEETATRVGVPHAVPVLGFGQGLTSPSRPDLTVTGLTVAATAAFEMAGLSPSDIDVAQFYDCFTPTVITALEDCGFVPKGQAGSFVAEGRIALSGDLPINTSGGLLSETGMPGMQLIIEAVRQLRGTANLQITGARKALVTGQGGAMQTHAALILGS
jgi:acetyl-CoA acetyltransferase